MIDVMRILIAAGSNPNTKRFEAWNILTYASRWGSEEIVKIFIDAGADLEVKDEFDRTALSYASMEGNIKIVKLLIDAGASVTTKDIDHALLRNHKEVVELLSRHSAVE